MCVTRPCHPSARAPPPPERPSARARAAAPPPPPVLDSCPPSPSSSLPPPRPPTLGATAAAATAAATAAAAAASFAAAAAAVADARSRCAPFRLADVPPFDATPDQLPHWIGLNLWDPFKFTKDMTPAKKEQALLVVRARAAMVRRCAVRRCAVRRCAVCGAVQGGAADAARGVWKSVVVVVMVVVVVVVVGARGVRCVTRGMLIGRSRRESTASCAICATPASAFEPSSRVRPR